MINFWAHGVDPAHQTNSSMYHALPETKLQVYTCRLRPRRQTLGIIEQRIELAC